MGLRVQDASPEAVDKCSDFDIIKVRTVHTVPRGTLQGVDNMTKKLLTIICMAIMLTACSNADSSTAVTTPAGQTTTTTQSEATTTTTTTESEPAEELTTTTTEEQSVTTTTTTTQTEPTVTTTTPEEETTTTTAETTKPKVTTTTKKPATTTKTTTTTAKKTTTTTTTTKKVDEPPKDAVKMYYNGSGITAKPNGKGKMIADEGVIPQNSIAYVVDVPIYRDYDLEYQPEMALMYASYEIYCNGYHGYVSGNSLSYLPIERADEEICMRINELRASLGLNELRIDEELCEMAAQRSVEISQTGQPHTRPDGSSFYTILDENGWVFYEDYFTAAENVQTGTDSARLAYECWRTSEGHYNNMVGNYTAMGLSRKPDGTGSWVLLLVREIKE